MNPDTDNCDFCDSEVSLDDMNYCEHCDMGACTHCMDTNEGAATWNERHYVNSWKCPAKKPLTVQATLTINHSGDTVDNVHTEVITKI